MAPLIAGRFCSIVPLAPQHYGRLFEIINEPANFNRWRRLGTFSPPELEQILCNGVAVNFVVTAMVNAGDATPIGLVSAYDVDPMRRTGSISVVGAQAEHGKGRLAEGLGLSINWLFNNLDLRKLYAELTDDSLERFGNLRNIAVAEGLLRQHAFVDGEYVDVHLLAIYREAWAEFAKSPFGGRWLSD